MSHRVVITGMGWITPMGHSIEGVWSRLVKGDSGIARTTLFDATTFPTSISAEVKGFELDQHVTDLEAHQAPAATRSFALAACAQAWKSAKLDAKQLDLDRVGIYLGSGEGSLDFDAFTTVGLSAWRRIRGAGHGEVGSARDGIDERHTRDGAGAEHAALAPGADDRRCGPAINCLTACAASTQAIGEAAHILRRGDADVMIGGGAHSMIHPFGVTGFNRLTALSTANDNPPGASRPFDLHRGGFVLGEGAGMVILETLEHAQARRTILAEVVGYGSTADAYRITDQDPKAWGRSLRCKPLWPMPNSRHRISITSTPTAPALVKTTATKPTRSAWSLASWPRHVR